MRSKKGYIILIAGLLCITAALALFVHNKLESHKAEESSRRVVASFEQNLGAEAKEEASQDFPNDNPDRQMPVVTIEGDNYVGILTIPSLDLELPVMAYLDYDALQVSPCLYSGSVYRNDMVIGAHNYDSHFGSISSIGLGAGVSFTDAENNKYYYDVINIETLRPDQKEELTEKKNENDWDLSMFTCNFSGSERVTVRCKRK